ncbi:MAG: Wzz/FepE/Etk N-terminal domain-containing protein, partial [Bacteroidota bacterium]
MNHKNIPIINEKFDFFTFAKVVKKNIWIIGINLVIAFIIGFLYLRYTPPTYEATSVIQVRTQNKTNEILGIDDMYEKGLDPVIELLRSREFLKRCLSLLPLEVSYFRQGTFLSFELYHNSPFEVNYQISNDNLKNTPIDVHFNDNIGLSYQLNNNEYEYTLVPNQWTNVNGGKIKLSISDYDEISFYQNQFKKGGYYFIINDTKSIIDKYSKRLNINILNNSAGTIKISFTDKNPQKTADVVNTISSEFLKYDVEKKKEGANNIISYIDNQLDIVMNQMDSTEKELNKLQNSNQALFQNNSDFMSRKPSYADFGNTSITQRINDFQQNLITLEFEIYTLKQIADQIDSTNEVNIYELMAMLSGTRSESFMKSMLNSMLSLYN